MRRMLQNAIKQQSLSRGTLPFSIRISFWLLHLLWSCMYYSKQAHTQWSPRNTLHACICIPLFLIKTSLQRQCKVDNLHTCTTLGIRSAVDNESEVQHSILCYAIHMFMMRNPRLYAILRTPLLVWRIHLFFRRVWDSALLLIWALCWRSDTWNGYWETVDAAAAAAARGPSSACLIHQPQYLISGARAPSFCTHDNTHEEFAFGRERERIL